MNILNSTSHNVKIIVAKRILLIFTGSSHENLTEWTFGTCQQSYSCHESGNDHVQASSVLLVVWPMIRNVMFSQELLLLRSQDSVSSGQ